MRLLMVSKALVRAAYRQKLVALARLGVEVTAVVPPVWREGPNGIELEPADDSAYRLIVSPMRLNGNFHLHWYPRLNQIIEEIRPDLVHLDEEPYNLATYLGMRASSRRDVPSIFFAWQNIVRSYPPPFRWIERRVFAGTVAALAGSEEAKDVLRTKGYARPVDVVPQFGVDPELFCPASRAHDVFTVGFLGRFVPGKGPLLTIEAMDGVADSKLLMVGQGPLVSAVEDEVERRGMGHRVTVRPSVPSDQIPDVLHDLDVLVVPSVTMPNWKEQFGRVLIEAMACGVPVIGSDSGEIPSVVGDAGMVVPEGDVTGLREALIRVRDDAALRADLRRRGRGRVLQHFTHARIAQQTLEFYRRPVAG